LAHAQLPIAPTPASSPTAPRRRFGETMRRDAWWVQSAVSLLVLGTFVVYATWAAFQGEHYESGPYLSPFYSPLLFGDSAHAWFGPKPGWWPSALPFSAALLILWAPGGFRFTCYYYRGAYYKAFWADPPACAVGEPRKKYRGESRLPLVIQNVHRYFLYLAVPFIGILAYDVFKATRFPAAGGGTEFGVGVGTLVMWVNVIFLAGYTFSCHSCRHVCGGHVDVFSKAPTQYRLWRYISRLNERHPTYAWLSLFSVGLTDLYIRLVAMGVIRDLRIL